MTTLFLVQCKHCLYNYIVGREEGEFIGVKMVRCPNCDTADPGFAPMPPKMVEQGGFVVTEE